MLIKITENQFINIHRCVIVEFFFDKDETAIELVADTESEGSVSLDKSCLNLEILEYHLYSNNFIKLGMI